MKYLLIDVGGVLKRNEDYDIGFKKLAKLGITKELRKKLMRKYNKKMNLGKAFFDEFIKELNKGLKKRNIKEITKQKYLQTINIKGHYNKELTNYLKNIKNVKFCIFTNNFKERMDMHKKIIGFHKWSHNIIVSDEHGMVKPHKKFYLLTLKKLKTRPEDCFMLDDVEENISTANKLGINGHVYTTNKKAINAINKWLKE